MKNLVMALALVGFSTTAMAGQITCSSDDGSIYLRLDDISEVPVDDSQSVSLEVSGFMKVPASATVKRVALAEKVHGGIGQESGKIIIAVRGVQSDALLVLRVNYWNERGLTSGEAEIPSWEWPQVSCVFQ